jgi:plasmid stabilization system protein ParE
VLEVESHPQVDLDILDALTFTLRTWDEKQVSVYRRLIQEAELELRRHPTIGRLREDIGSGIRVFCIAPPGIKAPHGYIYRVKGSVIQIARFVHLVRYLPALLPDDF